MTRACSPGSTACFTDPKADEVIGESLDTGISQVTGKMVDLDPDNQLTSTLFGLKLGIRAYKQGSPLLTGDFVPAAFTGIWTDQAGSTDSAMAASYQSEIENVVWGHLSELSPTLRALKAASPNKLSIKFEVRGYRTDDEDPMYTFGYVNGTIGPAGSSEPQTFVRTRLLSHVSTDTKNGSNLAPFVVRTGVTTGGGTLTVDFGNAFARVNGDTAYNTDALGHAVCLRTATSHSQIGTVIDLDVPWLETNIMEFDVPAGKLSEVNSELIELVECESNVQGTVLMTEIDVLVRPMTQFVNRMDPDNSLDYTFFASELGLPKCNFPISVAVTITPNALPWTDNKAESLFALKVNGGTTTIVSTDCSGKASVTLTSSANGPGNPRDYVDGQIYTVTYVPDGGGGEPYYEGVGSTLSLHLYDKFTYTTDQATWWGTDGTDGVQAILRQYANLYPMMRPIVALDAYTSVVENKGPMKRVFSVPESDPSYMPVTRDLSTAKRQMILDWLNKEEPLVLNNPPLGRRPPLDLPGLCNALQLALQVEHSTIPTYLYAYYSIKPGHNREIADILMSIVLEEMRHIVLAGNVLNAIDSTPEICPPPNLHYEGFIPVYPAPMPGGLRPELTLRLSPLSLGLVKDIFMEIEAPLKPLPVVGIDPNDFHHNTIGAFYKRVKRSMRVLNHNGQLSFKTDTSNQVLNAPGGNIEPVTNIAIALEALDEIIEQGEGSNIINPEDSTGEMSHYYKFAEIVYGKRLVQDPDTKRWSFTGDPVTFDERGIYPLIDNARTRDYKEGSRARLLASGFARSYLDLLEQLHSIFNGSPGDAKKSFSNMVAMTTKAHSLVKIPVNELGEEVVHAGPPFENPLNLFLDS